MACATSSDVPPRCMGTKCAKSRTRLGKPPEAWMSVSIKPGRTALTRMPSLATSLAKPIVKASMALLAAA